MASFKFRSESVMRGPRGLKGAPDHLFHNNGDGTFTNVSVAAGAADKDATYGFRSTFVDVNNDGGVDPSVAKLSIPNYLYINKGEGTFEDVSMFSGFALNQDGIIDLYAGAFFDDYKGSIATSATRTTGRLARR
jgi:hypothetical protein